MTEEYERKVSRAFEQLRIKEEAKKRYRESIAPKKKKEKGITRFRKSIKKNLPKPGTKTSLGLGKAFGYIK